MLPYVGTVDVARDMDRLRQALGDTGLTYMGQSYGTLLGLTYASLFPTRVRAMVLDSVIDPALSFSQITAGQAAGLKVILNGVLHVVQHGWRRAPGTPAPIRRPRCRRSSPLRRHHRLRPAGAVWPVSGSSTDRVARGPSQSDWPQLGQALADDAAGNGAAVASQSNTYNTGGSDNADDAATAIDCLDHPV